MGLKFPIFWFFIACPAWAADAIPSPQDIVQKSVTNTNADWAAAPAYDFTEHDVITRNGKRIEKTYQVMMIEGSTYNKLIALNGQPLPDDQKAAEDRKLQQEIDNRQKESSAERRKRVGKYQKERHQDHALMTEMSKAFTFALAGQETVDGRRCVALTATPKPGYRPPNRDTQVLRGMKGKMWVDTEQYQWVKVDAQVFRPVTFGLFFASVKPGTEFSFEQKPMQGNLWLPSHFRMTLNARVAFSSRRSVDDETYTNYHRAAEVQAKGAQ